MRRDPDDDRREHGDRRRSARGLFELRARRDGVAGDRRRAPRRWFWQRFRP